MIDAGTVGTVVGVSVVVGCSGTGVLVGGASVGIGELVAIDVGVTVG